MCHWITSRRYRSYPLSTIALGRRVRTTRTRMRSWRRGQCEQVMRRPSTTSSTRRSTRSPTATPRPAFPNTLRKRPLAHLAPMLRVEKQVAEPIRSPTISVLAHPFNTGARSSLVVSPHSGRRGAGTSPGRGGARRGTTARTLCSQQVKISESHTVTKASSHTWKSLSYVWSRNLAGPTPYSGTARNSHTSILTCAILGCCSAPKRSHPLSALAPAKQGASAGHGANLNAHRNHLPIATLSLSLAPDAHDGAAPAPLAERA